MPDTSWIEEREERHLAATQGPWGFDPKYSRYSEAAISPDVVTKDDSGNREHECCGSSCAYVDIKTPDGLFIVGARNEEPRVLAALKAAAALVDDGLFEIVNHEDYTGTQTVLCRICDGVDDHRADCNGAVLVAALKKGPDHA